MKRLVIFGVSGSVGRSTLEVIACYQEIFQLVGYGKHKSSLPKNFRENFSSASMLVIDSDITVEKICEFLSQTSPDIVINAVSGSAGLIYSLATLESGIALALANKESLVMAGDILQKISRKNNAPIIPIDSEHMSIFQSLIKRGQLKIDFHPFETIFLTCSGGALLKIKKKNLDTVTKEEALRHPTWDMGQKITIDSSTLANKGLEVFEAMSLFGATADQVKILIHPSSIIHSIVRKSDGSDIAQISPPDMKLPITQAISFPEMITTQLPRQSYDKLNLELYHPNTRQFPMISIIERVAKIGKNAPLIFNAANEIAVEYFLQERIKFREIFDIIEYALRHTTPEMLTKIEHIQEAHLQVQKIATRYAQSLER